MAKRSKYQTELTAFHEAGHAVAHAVLNLPFEYVTIVPDDDAAGHIAYDRPDEILEKWNDGDRDDANLRHHIERELITTLAGLTAQRRQFPRSHGRMNYKLSEDAVCLPDATGFALKPGMRLASPGADYTTASRIVHDLFGDNDVATEYLVYINARTLALIRDQWNAVERVAHALIERQRLDYDDVLRLTYPDAALVQ